MKKLILKRYFLHILLIPTVIAFFPTNLQAKEIFLKSDKKVPIEGFMSKISFNFKKYPSSRIDLTALFLAYPANCTGIEIDHEGAVYLIMSNDKRIIYDDLKKKTFKEKLDSPDLQDMMEMPYVVGPIESLPEKDFDPGRIRVMDFFMAVYGNSKATVYEKCVEVNVSGSNCPFNKENNAADALRAVSADLEKITAKNPKLQKFIAPLGGTFNWRKIAGTHRLSSHSLGIALDLNTRHGLYWRWNGFKPESYKHREKYPQELVDVFESHHFIWGGKWYHYDLMHFEYRPELFIKGKVMQRFRGEIKEHRETQSQPDSLPEKR